MDKIQIKCWEKEKKRRKKQMKTCNYKYAQTSDNNSSGISIKSGRVKLIHGYINVDENKIFKRQKKLIKTSTPRSVTIMLHTF